MRFRFIKGFLHFQFDVTKHYQNVVIIIVHARVGWRGFGWAVQGCRAAGCSSGAALLLVAGVWVSQQDGSVPQASHLSWTSGSARACFTHLLPDLGLGPAYCLF